MLRNNADARRCSYFELGLPVILLVELLRRAQRKLTNSRRQRGGFHTLLLSACVWLRLLPYGEGRKITHAQILLDMVLAMVLIDIGYGMLKPYGFPIHGAVDGVSRWVMWLNICPSNNDPCNVASRFYDCVKLNRCCPWVPRTDCGTENVTMATMQCYFKRFGNNLPTEIRAWVILRPSP